MNNQGKVSLGCYNNLSFKNFLLPDKIRIARSIKPRFANGTSGKCVQFFQLQSHLFNPINIPRVYAHGAGSPKPRGRLNAESVGNEANRTLCKGEMGMYVYKRYHSTLFFFATKVYKFRNSKKV